DGVGLPRITQWSWLTPEHLPKYVPHRDRPDEFHPDKIFKSTKPHSPAWYQAYRGWMSQQMVRQIEGLLNEIMTPRTDRFGNYLDAQGNVVPPVFNPFAGGVVGVVNAPPPAALAHPELRAALVNPATRDNAYRYVIKMGKVLWKTKHLEQHEELKWRA